MRVDIRRSGARAAARAFWASVGRHCDGWWPAGAHSPEDYAEKLKAVRDAAEQAGRDPMAITPAMIWTCLIADDDAELAQILEAPLIRAYYVMSDAGDDDAPIRLRASAGR